MRKLLVVFAFSAFYNVNAQVTTFSKSFQESPTGAIGTSVIETRDHGFALLSSGDGITLTKLDQFGSVQWRHRYSNGFYATSDEVRQSLSGGYSITGTLVDSSFTLNYYILMTDSNGLVVWWKKYLPIVGEISTPGYFYAGHHIGWSGVRHEITYQGNIVMAGMVQSNQINYKLHVTKTDSAGNILWTQYYDTLGYLQFVQDIVVGRAVIEPLKENYYVLSHEKSSAYMINALRQDGSLIWCNSYATFGGGLAYSIEYTADHCLMVCGTNGVGILVTKLDTSGNVIWSNAYDLGLTAHWGNCVKRTFDGNYLIAGGAGNTTIQAIQMKINGGGIPVWQYSYLMPAQSEANAVSLAAVRDSSSIISGFSDTGFFFPIQEHQVIRTDQNGNGSCGATPTTVVVSPLNVFVSSYLVSFAAQVLVTPVVNQFIPTAVTEVNPCSTTSVTDEPDEGFVSCYPNPSTGLVTLLGRSKIIEIEVYDYQGRLITRVSPGRNDYVLDLRNCEAGTYMCVVQYVDLSQSAHLIIRI